MKISLDCFEQAVCSILLFGLVIVACLEVAFRYILSIPLVWSEELARILFTWLVFVGAAIGARRGAHLSIDFFHRRAPRGARMWWSLGVDLMTIGFLAVLFVASIRLLHITYFTRTSALEISWAWVYVSLPISCGLMITASAHRTVEHLRQALSKQKQ